MLPNTRFDEAGKLLADAWLSAERLSAFPERLRPQTRDEAYAIQDVMAAVIAQPVTGWKLGATSLVMRARAGHDGAIIGRVFDCVTFDAPAALPSVRFPEARVECEFAFRMLAPVAPRDEPWTVAELTEIAELHPAFEIIGSRYPVGPDSFKPNTNDEIADNGAGIGFVFGPAAANWRDQDLRNMVIDIRVDDHGPAENFLGEDRCEPIEAVAQAAEILGARGITLEEGQYVSTGAATMPYPVHATSSVRARFGDLGTLEARFVTS